MESSRKIERMIFKCPEVNCRDYDSFPLLDEDDYMGMCSDFSQHMYAIRMYLFVKESTNYGPYVDLYIWDITNLDGYDHFVICDGFCLPEELETKFLEYALNKTLSISKLQFHEANERIIKAFPQWHYKDYRTEYIYIALQHLYFASHPCGPREILFKAEGLEYIAANMLSAASDCFAAYKALRDDHPEYFFLGFQSEFISRGLSASFKYPILYSTEIIDRINRQLRKNIYRMVRGTASLPLLERERVVYERIAKRMMYRDNNDVRDHNVVGPVLMSSGVWGGHNSLLMLCFRRLADEDDTRFVEIKDDMIMNINPISFSAVILPRFIKKFQEYN